MHWTVGIRRLLIICSLDAASSFSVDDETSLVQINLARHPRRHAKRERQHSAQVQPHEDEDLLTAQFKQEDITGMKIGDIVGFQTEYKWGQRLSHYELITNHTNSSVAWINETVTKLSYNQSAAKAKTFTIKGFKPRGDGPFPVYMSVTGDYCDFDGGANLDMVRFMAEKGYLAAAVEFDNGRFCPDFCQVADKCEYERQGQYYTDRRHYFNDTSSKAYFGSVTVFEKARGLKNSLDVLCDTLGADCSKGVAVSGFSEGSWILSALSLIDSRISAMLLFGIGLMQDYEIVHHSPWRKLLIFNQSCLEDKVMSKHVPRARRRYVDGARDKLIGYYRHALERYSGYHCENTSYPIDCIQPDGSGYYIVSPWQYTEADEKSEYHFPIRYVEGFPLHHILAGHNFFSNTRPIDKEGKLLPTFKHGAESWCFKPSFRWLASAARMHDESKLPGHQHISSTDA